MSDLLLIGALLLCTGASFFFSGIESGIYTMNRVRLRLGAEKGDRRASRVLSMVARPQLLISTILIGNHVANYFASHFSQEIVAGATGASGARLELLNTLLLTPFLFVLGEITPKNVFRIKADFLVPAGSGVLLAAFVLFRPVALLLRWLGHVSRALPRTVSSPDAMLARDRLTSLMSEVVEDGVLTPDQSRMVRNVMRISSIPVRDAMVPVEKVDSVSEPFTREELVLASARHGRTRVPVRAAGGERLLGVVNVLDLVFREDADPAELLVEVPSVRDSSPVDSALRILRSNRKPMGFVTDGQGRTVGIVTVKDLVEEVSGELPVF